jgi:hypothetical protein
MWMFGGWVVRVVPLRLIEMEQPHSHRAPCSLSLA